MKQKKILTLSISILIIITLSFFAYNKLIKKSISLPYRTEKPIKKTIKRIIETTGTIRIAKKIKIGSLITGIIKKLYADENEFVKRGQLLAEIETGKDDADVRQEVGNLEKATANYNYYKNYFERQKEIYKAGQLSKNEFDNVEKDFLKYKGEFITAKAKLDKAKQEFDNRKIYAPQDGIIIKVGIAQGERVTTDLNATVLFEIAKDISKMEATLEVDESDIGHVKFNQKVKFTVDSYPQKIFKTKINQISYSPKTKNGKTYYRAIVPVDNSENIFRPGLSIESKIYVAKSKDALAITAQAFMISSKVLKEIALDKKYGFNPIDKGEIKELEKESNFPVKTVWVVQKNGTPHNFTEKIVTTNLTDDIYYEIKSGLTEADNVIVDIEESNYMEEILKKAYRSKF